MIINIYQNGWLMLVAGTDGEGKGEPWLAGENSKRLEKMLARYFELPRDLVLNLPRITIIGNEQLVVENHRGIIEYTLQQVRISTSLGEVRIEGENLTLRNIFPEEIAVEGKIREIHLSD